MNYLYTFCIFGVSFYLIRNSRTDKIWGNASGSYLFQERVDRNRIPFLRRSVTIEYPVTHPDAKSKPLVLHILRGIQHVNLVDKEETGCGDPTLEITEGGLYYPNVKIYITSQRGCPLDSVVYFYGSK